MEVECHCGTRETLKAVKKHSRGVWGAPQEAQSIDTVQGQWNDPFQANVTFLLGVLRDPFDPDVHNSCTIDAVSPHRFVATTFLTSPLFVKHELCSGLSLTDASSRWAVSVGGWLPLQCLEARLHADAQEQSARTCRRAGHFLRVGHAASEKISKAS